MENQKLKVVLMRHGECDLSLGELNENRIIELKNSIFTLSRLFSEKDSIICFVSSSKKTLKTAQLIRRKLLHLPHFEQLNDEFRLIEEYYAFFDRYITSHDLLFVLSPGRSILDNANILLPYGGIASFDYSYKQKIHRDTIKTY